MKFLFYTLLAATLLVGCRPKESQPVEKRMKVILDTDANNELDDQHAIAYLLFNADIFHIEGITVNRTRGGGDVDKQAEEAERVVTLCGLVDKIAVIKGANGNFNEIKDKLDSSSFDGQTAVNFIIEKSLQASEDKLILLPIGKLTNIALALKKEPAIASRVRIVWLGSNYPESGEYNLENDTTALNFILSTEVPFEMVTVRYGKPSGTDAVRASLDEIRKRMPGKGPHLETPVQGRHEKQFTSFGDYSVDLFEHIDLHGDPPSRALFDMAAVAIVKNATWADTVRVPAPLYINNEWIERPGNKRSILIWENFKKDNIMHDFYNRMEHYQVNP
ncbi:MAG: nucleoside hydrolase [Cyclobacteriaceae bacterium]|nr:nucleoside hydrolase [Cyclobacteriaceae bacterium]